jgi:sarcosine oxidase subunit beta
VLAAGSGTPRLASGAGIAIPQQLVRHTVVLTEPVPAVTRAAAWTGDLFIRQDVRGSLCLATSASDEIVPDSDDGLPPEPSFDDVRFCVERVQRYFPGLGAVRLRRAWAGDIDVTPDGLPVIDGGGGPGGLVIATGMSGHGFGLAPVVGSIVAGIAEGAGPGFDLRPFRVARFHDGSRLEPAHLS